ncbi:hypothetical protein HYQ45_014083 [Verticillium longisporum]|uniref:Uncharacterized protein n=1 Tax=Verticillium longisporum TaxID=100787 RepID=A0A0G4LYW9_VERLO|nr:hypothetical protein HYQ45_014083 [Verticillium longisporum]CRK26740.1 hypothetical protein BN1708_014670 [Verticillium longisporum]
MSLTVTPQPQPNFGDHRFSGFTVPYNAHLAPQQSWGMPPPPPSQMSRGQPHGHPRFDAPAHTAPAMTEYDPYAHQRSPQEQEHEQYQVHPDHFYGGPHTSTQQQQQQQQQAWAGSGPDGSYATVLLPAALETPPGAQFLTPTDPGFDEDLEPAAPPVSIDACSSYETPQPPPPPPPQQQQQQQQAVFDPAVMSINPSALSDLDPNRIRQVLVGIHGHVDTFLRGVEEEAKKKRKASSEPLDETQDQPHHASVDARQQPEAEVEDQFDFEDRQLSALEDHLLDRPRAMLNAKLRAKLKENARTKGKSKVMRKPKTKNKGAEVASQDDPRASDKGKEGQAQVADAGENADESRGDSEAESEEESEVIETPTKVFDSISIVEGDVPSHGWTTDYYGLTDGRKRYGTGIGWETQETEAETPVQHPLQHTAMFVCKQCCLRWKGVSLENRRLFREDNTEERKLHRVPQAAKKGDPGHTRPGCREVHWYLDHDSGKKPCVRGLCDVCVPRNAHNDMKFEDGNDGWCCPPGLAKGFIKQAYKCIMDNCPFITSSLPEMRQHLLSAQKWPHKALVLGLIDRVKKGRFLSELDLEISARLMFIFNDRDAAGKPIVSKSDCTKLDPSQICNPANKAEHAQWLDYMDPPQGRVFHESFAWDASSNCWYQGHWTIGRDENCEPAVLPLHWQVLDARWDPRWGQYFLWPLKPPPKKKRRH